MSLLKNLLGRTSRKVSRSNLRQDSSQSSDTKVLTKELMAEVKKLHFSTKRIADENLLGGYRSAFKGRGIEFEDVREYAPGDDVRSIDWKVTARSGQPFVKRFREERELSVMIAVDVSASSHTGTAGQSRERLAAQIGAVFTMIAMQNNDKVGLVTYSDQLESYHPPKKARNSVWRIITEVMTPGQYNPGTDIDGMIQFLMKILKRRSVVILISDFFDPKACDNLAQLAKRHDVTAVVIEDASDSQLPKSGLISLRDPETGKTHLVDTSSSKLRKAYDEKMSYHKQALTQTLEKSGAGIIRLRTGHEFLPTIRQYFQARVKKKQVSISCTS